MSVMPKQPGRKNRLAKSHPEVRKLLDYAKAHGWAAERTEGGHIALTKPGCRTVHSSGTPRSGGALKNAIADMKRAEREKENAQFSAS